VSLYHYYSKKQTHLIPDGHAAVLVTVDDNGQICKTRMVACSVSISVSSSRSILKEAHGHNNNQNFTYGPNGELVPYAMEP
jgi:hypothetical protein